LRPARRWVNSCEVDVPRTLPRSLAPLPAFRALLGRVTLGVGCAATALACGPSYQALYEGDARFEHCYALEETGAVSMGTKGDCWRGWILHYTYGQTRDRVEYAAARYRALTRAPQAPTDEAMMEAAPGEGRASSIAAPAPTSAFAPPPKTLAETDAGEEPDSSLPSNYSETKSVVVSEETSPAPPGSTCVTGCDATWSRCRSCDGGAKCEACTATYKKCMRTCFAR
jgi:hypothetical protein